VPKVTINDVARACGVSKVTVSYVLNNTVRSSKISECTKERIKAAALELGYHPNALARGLTNRRTDSLVMVMPYTTMFTGGSAFITELIHASLNSAAKYAFDLILQTKTRSSAHDELAGIVDGRSDGALLLRSAKDPIVEALIKRKYPAVYIFGQSENPLVSSVDCDNEAGGYIAAQHLIQKGHSRIIYVGGEENVECVTERRNGYLQAMAEAGLTVDPYWIVSEEMHSTDYPSLRRALNLPNPPTAIFCWNDDLASTIMKFLQAKMGLRIPEDISIVGFDSTVFCEYSSPRLTSIRQPFDRICDAAFEILKGLIQGEIQQVQTLRFEPVLDERDSVRKI